MAATTACPVIKITYYALRYTSNAKASQIILLPHTGAKGYRLVLASMRNISGCVDASERMSITATREMYKAEEPNPYLAAAALFGNLLVFQVHDRPAQEGIEFCAVLVRIYGPVSNQQN